MNLWTLVRRSLRFHARSHLGTALGAALGSAVLTGALLVGDSVRTSLRQMALHRLGHIELALASGDRFFRAALANELASALGQVVAPGLQLDAAATGSEDATRANGVRFLGVDERFWQLALDPPAFPSPGAGEVLLNERLAEQLRVRPGDTVLFRAARPEALSREVPLTPEGGGALVFRLTVCGVVPDRCLGRFHLQPSQVPPFNAFVHLGWLQERVQRAGRANLLLVATLSRPDVDVAAALRRVWRLEDAELEWRVLPELGQLELRTSRVFLDAVVEKAVLEREPRASGVLTYFANELGHGDRRTPYSMVAAVSPPRVPADLAEDEMVVTDWLAEDLGVVPGDTVELRYYTLSTARQLEERHAAFRVRSVIPLRGDSLDRELMPAFPGIENAESTRDWDPTLPVSPGKIRPKDEDYWKVHRGTPKALISLASGQKLWSNRFGTLTALRVPLPQDSTEAGTTFVTRLETETRHRLDPAQFGLQFEPVRARALAAVSESQDFGGLFVGFSFFLIVAALLLMALLFQFGVEQRSEETGTLLALGFTPRWVRRFLWLEGAVLALLGGGLGAFGGLWYARAMIGALATVWRDAVGTSALDFYAAPLTLALGATAGSVVSGLTVGIALRRQVRRPARELLAGDGDFGSGGGNVIAPRSRALLGIAGLGTALATVLVAQAWIRGEVASAGTFFGAGALLLISALAGTAAWLRRLAGSDAAARLSLAGLGLRNITRRRNRSLSTVGLLACGSFLITAIGVFRLDAVRDAHRRESGTGGFAFMGQSTLPVVADLNTTAGREIYALDERELAGVHVLPLRLREGDEASCLNLNRAQQPRLLGVAPGRLAELGAFRFVQSARGLDRTRGWRLLEAGASAPASAGGPQDEVPAIGDVNSILWAMGRKVGDPLTYRDERGREFRVRIVAAVANSILQGSLLIDEAAFLQRFPSESGYRQFLIDVPAGREAATAATLTRALRDVGLELTPAAQRLAAFNAVQNTYLGTFQVLGGLGLLLGTAGLAVVVLRNVLERRGELALLLAVGFRPRALRRLLLTEHGALLILGLGAGVASAAVAVVPQWLSPGTEVPYATVGLTLGTTWLVGLVSTGLAAWLALRGELLAALRNE